MTAEELSYGHSSGKLETKAVFIDVIASKKKKAVTFSPNVLGAHPTTQ